MWKCQVYYWKRDYLEYHEMTGSFMSASQAVDAAMFWCEDQMIVDSRINQIVAIFVPVE